MCVFCSLGYPACNAHAPYCHPWPAQLYDIFPHDLIKGTIFEKKLPNTKRVIMLYSVQYVSTVTLLYRVSLSLEAPTIVYVYGRTARVSRS